MIVTNISQVLFSFRLLQTMGYSSPCHTVGPGWLSILHMNCVYLNTVSEAPRPAPSELHAQHVSRASGSLASAPLSHGASAVPWSWCLKRSPPPFGPPLPPASRSQLRHHSADASPDGSDLKGSSSRSPAVRHAALLHRCRLAVPSHLTGPVRHSPNNCKDDE